MSSLDQFYFLLHAYDLLGEHLYGNDWTAQELKQPRLDPPAAIEQRRAPFESQIAKINARDDEISAALRRETNDELVARLRREREDLFAARVQLQAALHGLPTLNEDYQRSYASYERAEKTKAVLIEALQSQSIRAVASTGLFIDWPGWSRMPGFRCYLPLSLVVLPRTISGLRRATVLIKRQEFETWLRTILPFAPSRLEQVDPEARCTAWLIELSKAHPLARPATKSALRDEAVRRFGISRRRFDYVWTMRVPQTWKERGAPKGRKIIAPRPSMPR